MAFQWKAAGLTYVLPFLLTVGPLRSPDFFQREDHAGVQRRCNHILSHPAGTCL